MKAYPGETTEAFCDGPVSGFSFFGGVPRSILYDNTRIAVARILGDGKRQRTRVFSELRSHYLFEDRFGRPGKGNDKGKVEGIVGYCRRNFLAPMPRFRNFDDLNTHLEACCAKRWAEQLRGHDQTVGERLERDRAVLQRLPAIAYDACDKRPGRVSSLSLVRYRGTDYSVPTRFGHCEVLVRGYVHEVVISCAAEVIARHPRSYEQEDFVFDPLHYLSLLEQKTNALDQAAPLAFHPGAHPVAGIEARRGAVAQPPDEARIPHRFLAKQRSLGAGYGDERLDLAPEGRAERFLAHIGEYPVGAAEPDHAARGDARHQRGVAGGFQAEPAAAHAAAGEETIDAVLENCVPACHEPEHKSNIYR